jgi:surface polysaccharide O-acyltransferase-like enzyme
MTATHMHLLINHLPIFGSILGALVLAHGLWTSSHQTKIAAYYLFIIAAIGACVAYFTGEGAEEAVGKLPGVVEATIKHHEQIAIYALVALIILGLTAIGGLIITMRKMGMTRIIAFVVLVMSIFSFGLVAKAGYSGGEIRHMEIYADGIQNAVEIEKEAEKE